MRSDSEKSSSLLSGGPYRTACPPEAHDEDIPNIRKPFSDGIGKAVLVVGLLILLGVPTLLFWAYVPPAS